VTLYRLVRTALAARRREVTRGGVARMWPAAARDVAALLWWRGVVEPVRHRIRPPLSPPELHPGRPLCNPQRDTERQR
jgi:hypothetical protein